MSRVFGDSYIQDSVTVIGNYEIFKSLEQSGFSKLHLGFDNSTNSLVYVKEICPNYSNQSFYKDLIQSEVYALKYCDSPYIVKPIDFIYDEPHDVYYIILPYCKKVTLFDVIKSSGFLKEQVAIKYMRHLLLGFKELRSKNVVHRDIKVRNILLINDRMVIFNLGLSVQDSLIHTQKYCIGTMGYMTPEMLNIQDQTYNDSIDIFALGVLFYQMLTCGDPFNPKDKDEYLYQIKNENISWKPEFQVSPQVKQLISQMTRYKKEDRIRWDQLFTHEILFPENKQQNPYLRKVRELETKIQNQNVPPFDPVKLMALFKKVQSRRLDFESQKQKYQISNLLDKPEFELTEKELYITQITRYSFIEYENLELFTITSNIIKVSAIPNYPISSIVYVLLRKKLSLLNKLIKQDNQNSQLINLQSAIQSDIQSIQSEIKIHESNISKDNNQYFKQELEQIKKVNPLQISSQNEETINKTLNIIANNQFNQIKQRDIQNKQLNDQQYDFLLISTILLLDCQKFEKKIWEIVSKYSFTQYVFQYEQLSQITKLERIEKILKE